MNSCILKIIIILTLVSCITPPPQINFEDKSIIAFTINGKGGTIFPHRFYLIKLRNKNDYKNPIAFYEATYNELLYNYLFNVDKGYYALAFAYSKGIESFKLLNVFMLDDKMIKDSIVYVDGTNKVYFIGNFKVKLNRFISFEDKIYWHNKTEFQEKLYSKLMNDEILNINKVNYKRYNIMKIDYLSLEKNNQNIEKEFYFNSIELFKSNSKIQKIFINQYDNL